MRIPPIKRLSQEDFPEQSWITKLFDPLNLFLNAMTSGLANGLTAQENMIAIIKTITVDGATPSTSFLWPFATKPVICIIGSTVDISSSPAVITQAVTCDWSYVAGSVLINNITGLDTAKSYSITFQVTGG